MTRKTPYRNQDKGIKRKGCVDCKIAGITTNRPAPHPGPRCAGHHRAKLARQKASAQEKRWIKTYGITAQEYDLIYAEQNGRCFLCRRATGAGKKKLSVDHDHVTGMVRGLLCTPCNRNVLGHARDEIEFFDRCIEYLTDCPAVRAIGERFVPQEA